MKIGIIGAGITGLSAAYELVKQGHTVEVFERGAIPGGLGTYLPVGGNHIERYYHHFFQSDKLIQRYATELGIADKLKFYPAKNAIFIDGKTYPFSGPVDLLRYPPLSLIDRLRCAITTGFFKIMPLPLESLDRLSAVKWIKKYSGEAVYQKIWGPLLEGKFSAFADKVPALWLWGRIYDRSFKLGYFDGSVKVLFDALINAITDAGGSIKLNAEITGIESKAGKVTVVENRKKQVFDKVIVTTVSPIAEKLFKNPLPKKYRDMLLATDHLGAVCMILELKYKVQSAYWVNICETGAPVLVMIEHTNFIPESQYGGKHIVYLANYLHRSDPRFKLSDEEVLTTYTSVLRKLNKDFKKSWITNCHISRVPRAQTIFQLNALQHKPPMRTPLKNVYMANIDQMYPHDRNLNQGIELGMKAAGMV
jgi:protoporphyrinogen oxidase